MPGIVDSNAVTARRSVQVDGRKRAPQPAKAALPAYQRIQRAVRKHIESGELSSGQPVSSERELAKIHGVSLMTARHALKELEKEGVVVRRPGAGTFVAPPRIHFNKLVSFTEQMASRGFQACSRTLLLTSTESEEEIAARLSLPRGTRLIKLERLRFAGDEPLAVETCYLPAVKFPEILRKPLDRRSLFDVLEKDYQARLAYADEEVDATAADTRTADMLHVPHGAALLRIRQILYSAGAEAIAYSLGLYRADRHSLLTRRFR